MVVPRKKKEDNAGNFEYGYSEFLEALGKAVVQIRRDSNLTQGELATRVHKQQPSIAKIENGPTQNVALRVLYEIAEAFPVPISRIFHLAEASLANSHTNPTSDSWQRAVAEMKKLTPQQQAWLGEVILSVLKRSTH